MKNQNSNSQIRSEYQNDSFHDTELSQLKNTITPEEYNTFLNLFKRFLNIPLDDKKAHISFKEQNSFLTEAHILANCKLVMGYHSPILAKLLYLYLSNGFDKAKIPFSRLINCFLPLIRDD